MPSIERERLDVNGNAWRQWGPYLSERAWGTVREDYSASGDAWNYFPHDHARSRAYRWNEDGLAGICDDHQHLCLALALWNGRDPILKERLFGLSNVEGNHGEDVKEYYFYLDSTPTHSYMKMLYKYPQRAYPYEQVIRANSDRSKTLGEYELLDTGIFDDNRYFDVLVEYAKAAPDDIFMRITATNRGPDAAPLHLLPTLWYRNWWTWMNGSALHPRPLIKDFGRVGDAAHLLTRDYLLGEHHLYYPAPETLLFTENDTNAARFFGAPVNGAFVKDAFHRYVIHGETSAVNPAHEGTKAAAYYVRSLKPGESWTITLRLSRRELEAPFSNGASGVDAIFIQRQREADAFFAELQQDTPDADLRGVQRQALAGMLWSKQFYHYNVAEWLAGDPGLPPPPAERREGRNRSWEHLHAYEVLSMPDKWEFPWFASWDMAFHCVPLALVDADFAKDQLLLLLREWYQHPNGQVPAYEWQFRDANPPVMAWAAWRVYKIEKRLRGEADRDFLEKAFHKLMLNFTWWVNREDFDDNNVFQGGFLGLDNIGVFDRSAELPGGGHLEQSDGTSWMGMFCLNMLAISLELARENDVYEDIATKFFEHFLYIAAAMNRMSSSHLSLWDENDEFFYDVLHFPSGENVRLKVRSLVGLIPLLAVETIEPALLEMLPGFRVRLEWFLENRPQLAALVSQWGVPGKGERRLLALARGHRMKALLKRALDPNEFLSDYGIRSISKYHAEHPFVLRLDGTEFTVRYEPGESQNWLFGGNSNWRGPIWFPVNYLLIEALQRFHHYYSDDFLVECPTGSGTFMNLQQIANELSRRLIRIFSRDAAGRRACFGDRAVFQSDPHWRDLMLFNEYFHGDTGQGLGASHQTGWTGLIAKLIQQQHSAGFSAVG